MRLEMFLSLLLICSTVTSLLTEAIKKIFEERKWTSYPNTIAGICSVIVSIAVGIGSTILTSTPVTSSLVVCLVALVFLSWLAAMVGYDKVMQMIAQITTYKKGSD